MNQSHRAEAIPTVSRLFGDTIVELVYDAARRHTALLVARDGHYDQVQEYETTTGEKLVPYSPDNNLIAQECVLLPSTPEVFGTKEALLADIEAYLHRYVDFSPVFRAVAAHYILLSWVHDAFNDMPILRVQGAYGSGKTRALIALGSIAYRGFFASGASTVSPIFHTLDRFGGTLVLDEADFRFSDKTVDLVKILNNGTVRGLPVLRTLQNRHKEFNPAAFKVFGPKILAMRDSFRDQALESRCITERMGTRPLRSDVPLDLPSQLKADALQLRNRLLDFRGRTLFSTAIDPSRAVEGLEARFNQIALPLLSLMDDPALRAEFGEMLRAHSAILAMEREDDPTERVLTALEGLRQTGTGNIPLQAVAQKASAGSSPVSAREAGRVLRDRSIPVYKSHGTMVVPPSAPN